MKPYLQNLDLECWLHPHRLGHAPWAVCLYQAEASACQPMRRALQELIEDGPAAQRVLTFKTCARPGSFSMLRLKLVCESDDLRVLCIAFEGGAVTVTVTDAGWQVLHKAVEAWHSGAEDFGVTPLRGGLDKRELGKSDLASGDIWFWGPHYWAP